MTRRHRWDVGLAVALAGALLGVVTDSATVVAAGVVGLAFAAYGYAAKPPEQPVVVERSLSTTEPAPGDRVEVEVEVRNAGDSPLAEVRVVDEPPSELPVVEGAPALATSLNADEAATLSYAVVARRGTHGFGEPRVTVRNVAGTVERHQTADLAETVTVRVAVDAPTLTAQTTPYDGRVDADAPGEGVAFHSVREFRPSDPLSRIDWKQFAKTKEFSTVQYRETRAATVVALVDVRPDLRVVRAPEEHSAVEYCAFAAGRVAAALLSASNRVGAATYGWRGYQRPGVGRDQRVRIRRFLREQLAVGDETHDGRRSIFEVDDVFFRGMDDDPGNEGGSTPGPPGDTLADGGWSTGWLTDRLPDDAQVVFCTPLLDEPPVAVAKELDAHGHAVTVVSPDVTTEETPGGVVARVRRAERLGELRPTARVVDWSVDEALAGAIDRAERRWAR